MSTTTNKTRRTAKSAPADTPRTRKPGTATKAAAAAKAASPEASSIAPSLSTAVGDTAQPAIVNKPQPVVLGPALRKKELFSLVADRAGVKKSDAKPVVEAMLSVLGEALEERRELVLPPFARLRVHKEKMTAKKRILFAKVHQSVNPGDSGPDDDSD